MTALCTQNTTYIMAQNDLDSLILPTLHALTASKHSFYAIYSRSTTFHQWNLQACTKCLQQCIPHLYESNISFIT